MLSNAIRTLLWKPSGWFWSIAEGYLVGWLSTRFSVSSLLKLRFLWMEKRRINQEQLIKNVFKWVQLLLTRPPKETNWQSHSKPSRSSPCLRKRLKMHHCNSKTIEECTTENPRYSLSHVKVKTYHTNTLTSFNLPEWREHRGNRGGRRGRKNKEENPLEGSKDESLSDEAQVTKETFP